MKPIIESLHGGWVAVGDGWTAYGSTPHDALLTYRLANKNRGRRRVTPARRRRISWRGRRAAA